LSNLFKPWSVKPCTTTEARVIDSNAILAEHMQKVNRPVPVREGTGETPGGFVEGITAQEQLSAVEEESAVNAEGANGYIEKAKEEAETILKQAKEHADEVVAQAENEAEQIRLDARREGYELGARSREEELEKLKVSLEAEHDSRMQKLEQSYSEKRDNMEKELVDVILPVFEKVFRVEFSGQKEILLHLIQNTILHIDGEKHFRIKVAEKNVSYLEEHKADILDRVGHDVELEIAVDPSMGDDDCMIETDSGIFECGQGIQLENLIKKIRMLCS